MKFKFTMNDVDCTLVGEANEILNITQKLFGAVINDNRGSDEPSKWGELPPYLMDLKIHKNRNLYPWLRDISYIWFAIDSGGTVYAHPDKPYIIDSTLGAWFNGRAAYIEIGQIDLDRYTMEWTDSLTRVSSLSILEKL